MVVCSLAGVASCRAKTVPATSTALRERTQTARDLPGAPDEPYRWLATIAAQRRPTPPSPHPPRAPTTVHARASHAYAPLAPQRAERPSAARAARAARLDGVRGERHARASAGTR